MGITKNNMINGREITSDSIRGLMSIGMEINKEVGYFLRNWSKYADNIQIRSYVEARESIWKEIQIIAYHATDEVVREAFATC